MNFKASVDGTSSGGGESLPEIAVSLSSHDFAVIDKPVCDRTKLSIVLKELCFRGNVVFCAVEDDSFEMPDGITKSLLRARVLLEDTILENSEVSTFVPRKGDPEMLHGLIHVSND